MRVREATYSDIDGIAALYDAARDYFRSAGIDQWLDGHPNADTAFAAIEDGICYVVLDDDGALAGTFVCDFSGEDAYRVIYDGEWLNDDEYAAVHNVAVAPEMKGKGVAAEMFRFVERRCRENGVSNARGDTHRDNISMQRALEKNGFVRCGTIKYLQYGERTAYQKSYP